MLGEVHEWKMTEEERLAYIKKHPIKPREKPPRGRFSDEAINYKENTARRMEALKKQGMRIVEEEDGERIHELYMREETLRAIADELGLKPSTVNNFIRRMRRKHPGEWPYRRKA